MQGDQALLQQDCFAIVGTRRPSVFGGRAALSFSRALSRSGMCIVSGLARGIDGFAHEGAMREKGKTIAVLGHGLDRIYPRENARLAHHILDNGGCLVSEYLPGVPPLPQHFPERNRIIAGLAKGVFVIEAAEKSGSLITCQMALDEGRDVFVLPGAFDDPQFAGSHALIRDGATVTLDPNDILEFYAGNAPRAFATIGDEFAGLRALFQDDCASLDSLLNRSPWALPELVGRMCQAMEKGFVAEISPQFFAWIGEKEKAE